MPTSVAIGAGGQHAGALAVPEVNHAILDCGFSLRPGSADDVIYDQVVRQNEYLVPAQFAPGSVVGDIGTHVGAFSYLAMTRGAAIVVGYEPERANYRCAKQNLSAFGSRAHVHCAAVWRFDATTGQLPFFPSSDPTNTGGGSVIWDTAGDRVDAVPLDGVVEATSQGGRRRVDLVKIDCEGAEFPILLTSKLLHRIDRIVGEYHELRAPLPRHAAIPGYTEFTVDHLIGVLRTSGFAVRAEPRASGSDGELGLFFARRESVSMAS
jgi:FkbM family methyltransferase